MANACGFVSKEEIRSNRVNFTAFFEALLNAKGINLDAGACVGKGGRKLSYTAKVQGNGNLQVGKAYIAMLDLKFAMNSRSNSAKSQSGSSTLAGLRKRIEHKKVAQLPPPPCHIPSALIFPLPGVDVRGLRDREIPKCLYPSTI